MTDEKHKPDWFQQVQLAVSAGGLLIIICGGAAEFGGIRDDVSHLNTEITEMRDWRTRQETSNSEFRDQVSNSFDEIKRHLERLD